MKFGICTSYQQVAGLEAYPGDYLEENVQRFLLPEHPQADFEAGWQAARNLPIPIEAANSLLPADLRLIATPTQAVDTQRLQHYIKTTLQRAEQVGIRVIAFGGGDARNCPPGYSRTEAVQQIGEYLVQWNEWGHEHGVQIVLESLRYEETNILNTVTESGRLLASLHDPNVRLLADTYHMASNNEAPEDLRPWSSLLSHVHVAEKQERGAPGKHGEDLRPYFAILHQTNYDQRISIECRWQNLATEVGPAMQVLKDQWRTSKPLSTD